MKESLRANTTISHYGDRDQEFASLEKDFEARSGFLDFAKVEVVFDALRSDPRYVDLLRRMELKP